MRRSYRIEPWIRTALNGDVILAGRTTLAYSEQRGGRIIMIDELIEQKSAF
jgi:hypothetical protein